MKVSIKGSNVYIVHDNDTVQRTLDALIRHNERSAYLERGVRTQSPVRIKCERDSNNHNENKMPIVISLLDEKEEDCTFACKDENICSSNSLNEIEQTVMPETEFGNIEAKNEEDNAQRNLPEEIVVENDAQDIVPTEMATEHDAQRNVPEEIIVEDGTQNISIPEEFDEDYYNRYYYEHLSGKKRGRPIGTYKHRTENNVCKSSPNQPPEVNCQSSYYSGNGDVLEELDDIDWDALECKLLM